jgi:alpha-ketoglutarate-dependent 2,4-dichlorophenoxyacetate dioxygenase
MVVSIRPADPARPGFVGEAEGIDLREPVSQEAVAAIEAGMDRFAVLVFHDQRIDDARQLAFSRSFGTLEEEDSTGTVPRTILRRMVGFLRARDKVARLRRKLQPARKPPQRQLRKGVQDISNLDDDNQVRARDDPWRLFTLRNMLWHSDSSFKPTPAKYSLLHARTISASGGNTEFADMRAAYDALDAPTKAMIQDLVCEHSEMYSREALGFTHRTAEERAKWGALVPQRLVRRHPVTGRQSLFLASHAGGIVGWPMPEARVLLRDLIEHATQREFVYVHKWQPYDLVMWDNRVTMHRARRYDATQVRDLHRTTVADIAPTLQQPA